MVRLIRTTQGTERHETPLDAGTLRIGRTQGDLLLPEDPGVSSLHATLARGATGEWRIEDHESTNHTYVNGKPVVTATLHSGDQIAIGHQLFLFWNDDDTGAELRGIAGWRRGPAMRLTVMLEGLLLAAFLVFTGWYSAAAVITGKNSMARSVRIALVNLQQVMKDRISPKQNVADCIRPDEEEAVRISLERSYAGLGYRVPSVDYTTDGTRLPIKAFAEALYVDTGSSISASRSLGAGKYYMMARIMQQQRRLGTVWIVYSLRPLYQTLLAQVALGATIYIVLAVCVLVLPKQVTRYFEREITEFRLDLEAAARKELSSVPAHHALASLRDLADTCNRLIQRSALPSAGAGAAAAQPALAGLVERLPIPAIVFDARGKLQHLNTPASHLLPSVSAGHSLLDLAGAHPELAAALPLMDQGGRADYQGGTVAVTRVDDGGPPLFVIFILPQAWP